MEVTLAPRNAARAAPTPTMSQDQAGLHDYGADKPENLTTRVVHQSEPHDTYIGRGRGGANLQNTHSGQSGWLGNPYTLADHDRREAVNRFARSFVWKLRQNKQFCNAVDALLGNDLACWCRHADESEPLCHGDAIVMMLEAGVVRRIYLDHYPEHGEAKTDGGRPVPVGYMGDMVYYPPSGGGKDKPVMETWNPAEGREVDDA